MGGKVGARDLNDDVIKWKHFPRHWPFVRGIHRSAVNSRTKASNAELWCFLWTAPDSTVEQTMKTLVIWDDNALIMTSLYWMVQWSRRPVNGYETSLQLTVVTTSVIGWSRYRLGITKLQEIAVKFPCLVLLAQMNCGNFGQFWKAIE